MKFANFIYRNKEYISIGDQVQLLAVDYIYQQMGINKQDIIYIDKSEISFYDGEPVILPINMPLYDYCEHGFAKRFSEKITPVFLGMTLLKGSLLPEEVDYFKLFEPIGCRDERTYLILQKYGIKSYLGGCVTVTLPRRAQSDNKKSGKVFIIDPPEGVKRFIPKNILDRADFTTHVLFKPGADPRKEAIERYKQYSDEASLIITSLLHASVPCMAMGIPVILVRDTVSYRLGWLEKLLHIYTPDEYEQIDWSPDPVNYETQKQLVMTLIKKRLEGQECSNEMQAVHSFYMDRNRKRYEVEVFTTIKKYIDNTWTDFEKPYKYGIWGLTDLAELTVDYITQRYPNAVLCHVYDKARTLSLRGIIAQHPDNIVNYPDEVVFFTAFNAHTQVKKFFEEIGRPENTYVVG